MYWENGLRLVCVSFILYWGQWRPICKGTTIGRLWSWLALKLGLLRLPLSTKQNPCKLYKFERGRPGALVLLSPHLINVLTCNGLAVSPFILFGQSWKGFKVLQCLVCYSLHLGMVILLPAKVGIQLTTNKRQIKVYTWQLFFEIFLTHCQ